MAKSMVHVLIPYTIEVACGTHGFSANAGVREDVTCKLCKRSEHYKNLPNSKIRKSKKEAQK